MEKETLDNYRTVMAYEGGFECIKMFHGNIFIGIKIMFFFFYKFNLVTREWPKPKWTNLTKLKSLNIIAEMLLTIIYSNPLNYMR